MMSISTELLKYTGPYISDRYDLFFNPNICHVCKSANVDTLESCDQCNMISYCSWNHKIIDGEHHREICVAITELVRRNAWYYTCRLTTSECFQLRRKLTYLIGKRINRRLRNSEQEIIMYAKKCYICNRRSDLHTCNICFSANFCSDHLENFYNYHASKCKNLFTILNCHIYWINKQRKNKVTKLYILPANIQMSSNALDFFGLNIHPVDKIWTAKPWTTDLLSYKDYYYSDCITYPLTVYYGIQEANLAHILLKRICVIHINLPNDKFLEQLPVWEVLFHFLGPKVQRIIIIIVSPFLKLDGIHKDFDFCALCKLHRKTLIVRTYSAFYKNYVSSEKYEYPNVIIAFNPVTHDRTLECITAMNNQECPFILTCMELRPTEYLITCINEHMSITRPLVIKNKFSSLTPHIATDTGDILYWNQYLVVYLKNSNEPVSCRSCI